MAILKKGLIIPDVHAPFHDKKGWGLAMQVAEKEKFDWCVILGDFPDFYSISSHVKAPSRALQFAKELGIANALLREVESHVKGRKVYIEGNHEDRYRRLIHEKVPELDGVTSVDQMLGLSKHGWEIVPYKDHIMIGRVYFTHDLGQAGASAVKNALSSYQDNIIIGHLHRFIHLIEGNAKGIPHVACCPGWLGDVNQVDYMYRIKAKRDWALGFGVAYLNPQNGWMYFFPTPIIGYTAVVEGRLYRA